MYKKKAITFSYDDGVTQDVRLIEIFNKYGLKATFNLNSELLGGTNSLVRNERTVTHNKNKARDVKFIYDGHEVAAHTLTHPFLPAITDDEKIVRQVEEDRINLSEMVGYEVVGLAYPCSGENNDERTARIIRERTGIKYARGIDTTLDFAKQSDLYRFKGTIYHHEQWDKLFETAERFLSADEGIFYIWGHSYEFDIFPERWELFEEFCKIISGKSDIFYGTNKDVLLTDKWR